MEDEKNTKKDCKEGNKELDRYERIVERANKEIERVYRIYRALAWILGTIVTVGIACGTFLTYNTINEMRSDLDQRTEQLANEVKVRIEKEFKQEDIHELVVNQARIRVDAVADKLIGKHVEDKIDTKLKVVDVKLKTLNDKTETLKGEFATVIKEQELTVENFTSDQDKKRREITADIIKQQKLINRLITVANTQDEKLARMIRLAKPPELILSSQPIIQKVRAGYEIKLEFKQPKNAYLGRIAFEVQVVDTSAAKILDVDRVGTGITLNMGRIFAEDGKQARFIYSPVGPGLQRIKIQVSGTCELSISGNYLAKPFNIVVK